jgi:alpha/beta superfamily hydrolase
MERNRGLVHFIHGQESGPWGIKIQRLALVADTRGYAVESLDYSAIGDPLERVNKLVEAQPSADHLVLVGSSMGGYVATVASKILSPNGLFLMAPAFFMPGYDNQDLKPNAKLTTIVHGWRDEIIPPHNSFLFAEQHEVQLQIINGDHRLNDQIDLIEIIFDFFLQRVEGLSQ